MVGHAALDRGIGVRIPVSQLFSARQCRREFDINLDTFFGQGQPETCEQ